MSTYDRAAPQQMEWLNSLPSQNFGDFYYTIKHPGFFGRTKEYRQRAIGQLCDGTDRSRDVCWELYHHFPDHGKGCVYISWRAVPDDLGRCKNKLAGVIENPQPFCGEREDGYSWSRFTASGKQEGAAKTEEQVRG